MKTSTKSPADVFDALFPPLPIAVMMADVAEAIAVEYMPDPRAAFARAMSKHEGMSGATFYDPARNPIVRALIEAQTADNSGLMRLAAMGAVPMKGGAV